MKKNETKYVGGAHWAVIADILPGGQKTSEDEEQPLSPELLVGLRAGSTTQKMLSIVPPKPEADRLISKYFSSLDLAAWVHHAPTFYKEYLCFWNDPSAVSLNWLSILFSMMCLATDLSIQSGELLAEEGSKVTESVVLFRHCSAQCLLLSDYTKPTTYTVDALLLYLYCELLRFQDTNFGLDVVLATIVRVAMRMGYHRDPSHYPNISIFAGEMRRRVWGLLIQLDILVSLQIGLSRLINDNDSDTKAPRNIPEEEMDPEMTVLPDSKSDSSGAVPSYMRSRTRLVSVLGLIHGHVTSVHPMPYETVIQLHEMLTSQQGALPASLKVRKCPLVTDSAAVVMRRLSLDLLYQKSRCVLHRRYMKPEKRLSWETCIDAALTIIHHQSYVYRETQSGGVLSGHLWKIIYLATYDFLLASMLLCLGLHWGINPDSSDASGIDRDLNSQNPAALLSAMEDSYMIWTDWCTTMKDTKQVPGIVKTMLDRVKRETALEQSKQNTMNPNIESDNGLGTRLVVPSFFLWMLLTGLFCRRSSTFW